MNFGFSVGERTEEGRAEWLRYYENSLVVPGVETAALCAAAREHGIWLSIGISERDGVTGTLYNSNLIIRPDGTLEPVHRKLRPTGSERVVWGDADRGFFPAPGRRGGRWQVSSAGRATCRLRAPLSMKRVSRSTSPPTRTTTPSGRTPCGTLRARGAASSSTPTFFSRATCTPRTCGRRRRCSACRRLSAAGGSCIVDPFGHYVTQPVWDREEIIFAELDMTQAAAAKMELDVCGHYARPDVLRLTVNDR